ncbi:LuxR C-terminal-related transcriptional regulator [Kribbella shirazensis]|uniref:DNA-binding CsgD family transcriptional regulator n=1 Tax=Kribbella shirazensis TaxID=1105143 RepID=A0A7X5VDS9_9ACTN|nr:GAF domain-containing protein [Kribbella shirazensis]NIK59322.1 DNA-binding CsgD family transcriptional regulator [Kribbella shirazensis]
MGAGDRLEVLIRRCYAGLDADQLRSEVLARLRGVLTVDAAFFATVDPSTVLFTSAVADEPLRAVTEQFLANEFGQDDVNKFAVLAGGAEPVRSLGQSTRGDWAASPRYVEVMRPLGLGDEMRAALRSNGRCWGVLCLHREDAGAGFAEHEIQLVRRLAPHLGEGLRRGLREGPAEAGTTGAETVPRVGPGVVVLDAGLRLESVSTEAEYWLDEIGAPGELPVAVRSVAARMHADRSTARLRVRTRRGEWLELQASELGENGQTAVVIEPVTAAELGSLLLDLHGLTPAQRRVTELLLRGYSTRQIVERLCLSPYTVQEHVRASFDKVGVGSRRELVSVLLRGSASRG